MLKRIDKLAGNKYQGSHADENKKNPNVLNSSSDVIINKDIENPSVVVK